MTISKRISYLGRNCEAVKTKLDCSQIGLYYPDKSNGNKYFKIHTLEFQKLWNNLNLHDNRLKHFYTKGLRFHEFNKAYLITDEAKILEAGCIGALKVMDPDNKIQIKSLEDITCLKRVSGDNGDQNSST